MKTYEILTKCQQQLKNCEFSTIEKAYVELLIIRLKRILINKEMETDGCAQVTAHFRELLSMFTANRSIDDPDAFQAVTDSLHTLLNEVTSL